MRPIPIKTHAKERVLPEKPICLCGDSLDPVAGVCAFLDVAHKQPVEIARVKFAAYCEPRVHEGFVEALSIKF